MPIRTRWVKVAAASLNQTPLDWNGNRDNIISVIRQARARHIHFLCCPELCITGYGCEDSFLSVSNCRMAIDVLHEILPETKSIVVALGLPILFRDGLYNAVCLVVDGKIAGFVAKQYLAGDGVHYEPRWFKPWKPGMVAEIALGKSHYPLGDLVFDINDLRIGFEICEDAWVASRTGIQLANRGVDILFNPSASHFAFGKSDIRKRFVQEGARAFGVGYIYANLLGNEAGRIIYDGDTIIAAGSQLIASGPRFSFKDSILTEAILDIEELRIDRAGSANYPKLTNDVTGIVQCSVHFLSDESDMVDGHTKTSNGVNANSNGHPWELGGHRKEQEFTRAAALGLFDAMRKPKLNGFVLNLSGGIDSSTCACLVYIMAALALKELGALEFIKKLSHIPGSADWADHKGNLLKAAMPELLYCLYQRTVNNSSETEHAARALAEELGCAFGEVDIDPLVEEYTSIAENLMKRSLNWRQDDLALQNIQARVRGPSAWLLTNVRKAMLLSACNRSEASVGYATMDGDTCGGLSPIAGVGKTFLVHWLHWIESGAMEEIGKLSALELVFAIKPTAELRPRESTQTDESDLMPYIWLDFIEQRFVRDKRSPKNILNAMQRKFPEASPEALKTAIRQFFNKWAQNQWKRERIAPGLHLDQESVDPKTWFRFPILSGGFKRELDDL